MAVAHDSAVESHTGTTGASSVASYSWTHAPVGTPKGILVFTINLDSATGITTAVTYGAVALAQVPGSSSVDTATELGRCSAWFLGDADAIAARVGDVVEVTRTNNTNVTYAVSILVQAAAGKHTAVHEAGIVLLDENGTLAEQSVTDGSPGTDSVRYAAGMTGLAAPPAVGASSTLLHSIDIGAQGAAACRETTAGQGARNVGFSSGTADDRAFTHLAIKEVDPPVAAGLPILVMSPYQAFEQRTRRW